jgi:beta-lactamase class A
MSEDRHDASMIDAPALPPPAIMAPAPREVSFGLVAGTAPAGTRRLIVRVGERVLADRPLRGRTFSLRLDLPGREVDVRVTAVAGTGRRSSSVVRSVFGLPRAAASSQRLGRADPVLTRAVRSLTRAFRGTSAVYAQDLGSGRGAAWNARARFPAASTLKLAIAVSVLRAQDGKPEPGSRLDALLRSMLVHSDNDAANALEVWLAGSTSAGSARVNETMRALGLTDSEMYGGYETTRTPQSPIPVRVDDQPAFGVGKHTTAWDLGRLLRATHLAAVGRGPLLRLGVTSSEARYLLWQLAHVADRGKLGRFAGGIPVLHKAGWLGTARHDAGLLYHPGGVFVATVLTWNRAGVGAASDVLAGRVALVALGRLDRSD